MKVFVASFGLQSLITERKMRRSLSSQDALHHTSAEANPHQEVKSFQELK